MLVVRAADGSVVAFEEYVEGVLFCEERLLLPPCLVVGEWAEEPFVFAAVWCYGGACREEREEFVFVRRNDVESVGVEQEWGRGWEVGDGCEGVEQCGGGEWVCAESGAYSYGVVALQVGGCRGEAERIGVGLDECFGAGCLHDVDAALGCVDSEQAGT